MTTSPLGCVLALIGVWLLASGFFWTGALLIGLGAFAMLTTTHENYP